MPFEIKEASIKAFFGILGMNTIDYLFHPGAWVYSSGCLIFALNYLYQVTKLIGNAIVKLELNEDGKSVTVTFKTGGTQNIKIKDITKLRKEKTLVETFEECYLFPISVNNTGKNSSTYYFYGSGQDAIKNGEIFRAIING